MKTTDNKTRCSTYYNKHKATLLTKITCEICGGTYNSNSKWIHCQGKYHTKMKEILDKVLKN